LDDFSRFILYAILVTKETTWEHILALETVACVTLKLHHSIN